MNNDLAIKQTPPAQQIAALATTPLRSVDPGGAPTPVTPHVTSPSHATQDSRNLERNVQEAVDRLNDQMRQNNRGLNFSIDRAANRTVITVKNTETGEVIRQIPDEKLLRVSHNLEALKGMLHNETS